MADIQKTIQEKLTQHQQDLIETLKPMTPKERFEYNQNRIYEAKDLLMRQIDDYRAKVAYVAGYGAYQDIKRTYFDGYSDRYDKEISNDPYYGMGLGKMYTFSYPKEGSIEINTGTEVPSQRLPYFDTQPIIIYCGHHTYQTGRQIVTGINLKYYVPYVRTTILNILVEAFKKDIYGEDNYIYGQVASNTSSNFKHFFNLISMDLKKMRIEYAIRRYYAENMWNIRLIKRKDFVKVAIMDTSNTPFHKPLFQK